VSVRGLSRFGKSMSVLDFLHLGSSLSLRSFARLGSSLSIAGTMPLPSISVRGLSRFGKSMSVLDFLHLGSSLSLRSFARMGSSISVHGGLLLGDNSYIRYNSGIEMRVSGARALTATSTGGTLHGAWNVDNIISTSDKRLKRDIEPLALALAKEAESREPSSADALNADTSISWVLRELRPVAYRFNRGSEAKYMRLGFIAQELESVLPMLTRPISDAPLGDEAFKGVVITDLIAVLVSHAQTTQRTLEAQVQELQSLRQRVADLEARLGSLSNDFERRVGALENDARHRMTS
jgi:hypothetical protein